MRTPGRYSASLRRASLLGLLLAALPPGMGGQEVSLSGQIRPRLETRTAPVGPSYELTTMRLRIRVEAHPEPPVRIVAEFQDVRTWGEERSTLADFSADNLDLHQGFFEVTLSERWSARIGRQEIAFGGERLIGAVGWAQQGRSFDAVRTTLRIPDLTIDVFRAQLSEEAVDGGEDSALLGVYAVASRGSHNLDTFGFLLQSRPADTRQWTTGLRAHGRLGALAYRVEGAAQVGRRSGERARGWMFGMRLGHALPQPFGDLSLWYDHLSGDAAPDDGTVRTFETLFATNHKFYGFADLFLNIPRDTGGRGLRDLALKWRFDGPAGMSIGADLHAFRLAEGSGLETGRLAEELDITLAHGINDALRMTGGLSYVWGRRGLAEIGRDAGRYTFTYLMTSVVF
ncbi:MAG: alginate export family protein [Gemmatimonadetes bacterium]|nr:alginate export family protein [Gemmatimonadota bacterium]